MGVGTIVSLVHHCYAHFCLGNGSIFLYELKVNRPGLIIQGPLFVAVLVLSC